MRKTTTSCRNTVGAVDIATNYSCYLTQNTALDLRQQLVISLSTTLHSLEKTMKRASSIGFVLAAAVVLGMQKLRATGRRGID